MGIVFYPQVDFCIWVLEQDGLRVPPFDCHPPGNGSLQIRGMDADAWRLWIKRIVVLLDQRIYWHIDNLQVAVDEAEALECWAEAQFLVMNPEAAELIDDSASMRPQLVRSKIWQEEQYQIALALAVEVYGDSPLPDMLNTKPTEVWQGKSIVKELLDELWIQYCSIARDRAQQRWINHELHKNPSFWEDFPIELGDVEMMHLNLVAYSKQVEYVATPTSVIFSLTDPSCSSRVFKNRVLRVRKELNSNKFG